MTVMRHFSGVLKHTNPRIIGPAGRLPTLAVLHHRGRTTGRAYDTPVHAFRTKNGILVGLALGSNAQWAQNLLAAGNGEMTKGGREYTLTQPRRRGPEARKELPAFWSFMFRALGIADFMEFDALPQA